MLQSIAAIMRVAEAVQRLSSVNGPRPEARAAAYLRPERIDEIYDGRQGAMLVWASRLSGNIGAAERILRDRQFDLRGLRNLLDVGSGAGQLAAPVLRYADAQASLTCCDRSSAMLLRARQRLDDPRPKFVVADATRLPFADHAFDGVTCGYVLEHLPDPRMGLTELARILVPGGKMLLLTTEDNLFGKLTSRAWCCRAHSRDELQAHCHSAGLIWGKEIYGPRWHQVSWIGGICVELIKPGLSPDRRHRKLSLPVRQSLTEKSLTEKAVTEKEICHGRR